MFWGVYMSETNDICTNGPISCAYMHRGIPGPRVRPESGPAIWHQNPETLPYGILDLRRSAKARNIRRSAKALPPGRLAILPIFVADLVPIKNPGCLACIRPRYAREIFGPESGRDSLFRGGTLEHAGTRPFGLCVPGI